MKKWYSLNLFRSYRLITAKLSNSNVGHVNLKMRYLAKDVTVLVRKTPVLGLPLRSAATITSTTGVFQTAVNGTDRLRMEGGVNVTMAGWEMIVKCVLFNVKMVEPQTLTARTVYVRETTQEISVKLHQKYLQ
jgi:hypothetical protein